MGQQKMRLKYGADSTQFQNLPLQHFPLKATYLGTSGGRWGVGDDQRIVWNDHIIKLIACRERSTWSQECRKFETGMGKWEWWSYDSRSGPFCGVGGGQGWQILVKNWQAARVRGLNKHKLGIELGYKIENQTNKITCFDQVKWCTFHRLISRLKIFAFVFFFCFDWLRSKWVGYTNKPQLCLTCNT